MVLIVFGVSSLATAADAKHAVPNARQVGDALKLVNEVYKADFEAAQTGPGKVALATKLLGFAEQAEQPASKYVLLDTGRKLAIEGDDFALAASAVEKLSRQFDVDRVAIYLEMAEKSIRMPRNDEAQSGLLAFVASVVDEAVQANRFAEATRASNLIVAAARSAKNTEALKNAFSTKRHVADLARQYAKVMLAQRMLVKTPENPGANLVIGQWLCFEKNDWEKGLPSLAKSSDFALSTLAKSELGQPEDAATQIKIADQWWKIGETKPLRTKANLRRHSGGWYAKAAPNVSGLVQKKIEDRLAQLDKAESQAVVASNAKVSGGRPVPDEGVLLACYSLGPFPKTLLEDDAVLRYIQKGPYSKPLKGKQLNIAKANVSEAGARFVGPDNNHPGHDMYFVFPISTDRSQEIHLLATTYTKYRQSDIVVFVNGVEVKKSSKVALRRGDHVIVVKQSYHKSGGTNRSWITLTLSGKGLKQIPLKP